MWAFPRFWRLSVIYMYNILTITSFNWVVVPPLPLIGMEKFLEPLHKGEIGSKLSCKKLIHRD